MALASQLAVPLYVFAGGWSAGVGLQGWMRIAEWLGPAGVGWMQAWLGRLLAVSLIHALAAIPWCFLIVGLGLAHSVRTEEESALLEGGWRTLIRYVWLPRLRIWILVACLWCAVGLMTEMVVSNLFMFGTLAELVYLDFSRQMSSPLTYLSATGLCFLPLLICGFCIVGRLPRLQSVISKPEYFGAAEVSLGKWRASISLLFWTVLAVLIGLPVVNLVVKAGWTPQTDGNGPVSFSWKASRFLQTCIESLTLFQTEYYWSAVLGLSSTLVATVVAVVLFWGTWLLEANRVDYLSPPAIEPQRRKNWLQLEQSSRSRVAVHFAMLTAIAIPGPLVGALVTGALNRSWPEWIGHLYTTTLAAPILAQQFRLLPCSWLLVCAIMSSIPFRTWVLARQDELTSFQILRFVIWPQTWPKWIAMIVLLLLLSVGELSCSIGVLPPGVTTTSMRLFELLHFGMRHQDSAICGVLIIFGWMAALILSWAVKRRSKMGVS